jgi:hypothetical protein
VGSALGKIHIAMNFDRWFWKDDTPMWSKRVGRFLLIASALLLLGWLVWLIA